MNSSQRSAVPEEERRRLAGQVARHILFKYYSHPGVPVKREELVAVVQQQYPNQKGLLALVIPLAQQILRDALGFELSEMGQAVPRNQSQSQSLSQALSGAKLFGLKSTLSEEILRDYVLRDDTSQDMALRMTVCAIVDGAGGSIPEDALWRHLARMGMQSSSTRHAAFGNAGDTLQLLAKEKYLVFKKGQAEDGSEAPCVELGPQAHLDFPRRTLKEYFEAVCDERG